MRKFVFLLAVLGIFFAAGCGEEFMTTDMATVADASGSTLTMVASPDNLNVQAGGSVTIMVSVIGPDGDGVESAAVLLTSTMGTLASTELTTDTDGYAATTLTPSDLNGYAVVVGTYKGIQAMVEVDFWTSATQ